MNAETLRKVLANTEAANAARRDANLIVTQALCDARNEMDRRRAYQPKGGVTAFRQDSEKRNACNS